jgi:hypothetical protein
MMTRVFPAMIALVSIVFATAANADFDRHGPQTGMTAQTWGPQGWSPQTRFQRRGRLPASRMVVDTSSEVIAGRPAGCPARFCGCALSLKLFGRIIPRLNLASNWKGFPRAPAAPGMIAARGGHVLELVAHVDGNVWSVWDPNSGGGRTRVHQRSIAGYTVHNPRGAQLAGLLP